MPDPTSTNALFERAAAKVFDVFGQRNPAGEVDEGAVVIKLLNSGVDVPAPAIVGKVRREFRPGLNGSELLVDAVPLQVPAAYCRVFEGIPVDAVVILWGKEWQIGDESERSELDLTLKVFRPVEDAAFERILK